MAEVRKTGRHLRNFILHRRRVCPFEKNLPAPWRSSGLLAAAELSAAAPDPDRPCAGVPSPHIESRSPATARSSGRRCSMRIRARFPPAGTILDPPPWDFRFQAAVLRPGARRKVARWVPAADWFRVLSRPSHGLIKGIRLDGRRIPRGAGPDASGAEFISRVGGPDGLRCRIPEKSTSAIPVLCKSDKFIRARSSGPPYPGPA